MIGDVAFRRSGTAQIGRQLARRHDGFGLEQHPRRHDVDHGPQGLQQLMRLRLVHAVAAFTLPQEGGGVEPEHFDAAVGQAQQGARHFQEHRRIGVIQVPLIGIEGGPHPAPQRLDKTEVTRCHLGKYLAQRGFVTVRLPPVGEDMEHRPCLCVAGTRGPGPLMLVGHMVEDEIRTQADTGLAQLLGQCLQIGIAAQRRFDLVEIGDGKAAIVLAGPRPQKRQQVQISDAQFAQIRYLLGHTAQAAAEVLHIGAVAQHALAEEPVRLRRTLRIECAQRRRTGSVHLPHQRHQFAQPGIELSALSIQAGQQAAQQRLGGRHALHRLRAL